MPKFGEMKRVFFFSMLVLASCQQLGLQPQHHFREALENTSMSPSLVRIALGDGANAEITCVFASRLLVAIAIERDLETPGVSKKDFDFALSQKQHQFAFARPEAIRELRLDSNVVARRKACAIIARGKQAMRADYIGEIVEGVWKGS